MIPGLNASLVIGALGGVALGGGVTWAAMRVQQALVVSGAVKGERAKQIGICEKQLADQALQVEADTLDGIALAGQASDAIKETPETMADRIVICKSDPACRNRGSLP